MFRLFFKLIDLSLQFFLVFEHSLDHFLSFIGSLLGQSESPVKVHYLSIVYFSETQRTALLLLETLYQGLKLTDLSLKFVLCFKLLVNLDLPLSINLLRQLVKFLFLLELAYHFLLAQLGLSFEPG